LVQYVFVPGQYKPQDLAESVSYKDAKMKMQREFLAKF